METNAESILEMNTFKPENHITTISALLRETSAVSTVYAYLQTIKLVIYSSLLHCIGLPISHGNELLKKFDITGYSCQCDRGFVLNLQGTSCIDDNECRSGIYCRGGRCLNTIGGFQCECPQGSQPSFDRKVLFFTRSCKQAIDEFD